MPGTKITTHKQRFGHVDATNRNSHLNIICIKLLTQVKKLKFRRLVEVLNSYFL